MIERLLTTSLDIDSITCDRDRSEFSEADLENLARAMIASKGIINPILVKELSPIKFAVIEGHFEYYAAVKASEIDFRFAEIRAIVVPKDVEIEEAIANQVSILRGKVEPNTSTRIESDGSTSLDQGKVLDRINSLEKLFTEKIAALETEVRAPKTIDLSGIEPPVVDLSGVEKLLENFFKDKPPGKDQPRDSSDLETFLSETVVKQLQDQITTLEVFHEDNSKTIRQLKVELQKLTKPTNAIDRVTQLLNDFNTLDEDQLKGKMTRSKLPTATINKVIPLIFDCRNKGKKFESLQSIRKLKAPNAKSAVISDASLITLIENWE